MYLIISLQYNLQVNCNIEWQSSFDNDEWKCHDGPSAIVQVHVVAAEHLQQNPYMNRNHINNQINCNDNGALSV